MVVDVHKLPFVHKLLLQEFSVTRVVDLHFPHHLADDDFKVLVVDLHTLKAVNLLNFIDNVFLNLDRAKDVEDVGRGDCTVGKPHSGLHIVVLLHQDLFCKRNEISLLDS